MGKLTEFPHYRQLDAMDCGATCLRMIAKHYGKNYTSQTLRKRTYLTREGVSLLGISDAAESIGMHTMGVKTTLDGKHSARHILSGHLSGSIFRGKNRYAERRKIPGACALAGGLRADSKRVLPKPGHRTGDLLLLAQKV